MCIRVQALQCENFSHSHYLEEKKNNNNNNARFQSLQNDKANKQLLKLIQ